MSLNPIATELNFQTADNEGLILNASTPPVNPIKEEIVRDDDNLLFTQAEMEELAMHSGTFQLIDELDGVSRTAAESSGATQGLVANDVSFAFEPLNATTTATATATTRTNNNLHRTTTQLLEPYPKFDVVVPTCGSLFLGDVKNEALPGGTHFVKYKVQDGKHCKVWECGICSKEFGHQYTLMRHLPTHTDERKFQCNTCGKAFRQMSTLSQHRAIHSTERPYICDKCRKTFNRISTLISHRKTHLDEKPHKCHLCNKAFHQKGNLRNHIFTHTNLRPYKCNVCAKGFNQMSNLMCHKLKAHQRADKPRYVCQICEKDFQKRIELRNHEQYHHGCISTDAGSSGTKIEYTNGVLVEPINTAAMRQALATHQVPFALLRPLNGIPVLVRILSAGTKQMLVPATAEDLKKHGQISIRDEIDANNNADPLENAADGAQDKGSKSVKPTGSTVQIKIPVVATVVQRCSKDGSVCMAVQSPESNNALAKDNYYFTSAEAHPSNDALIQQLSENNVYENSTQIQYIDMDTGLVDQSNTKIEVFQDSFSYVSESESVFSNGSSSLMKNDEDAASVRQTPTVDDYYDEILEKTQVNLPRPEHGTAEFCAAP